MPFYRAFLIAKRYRVKAPVVEAAVPAAFNPGGFALDTSAATGARAGADLIKLATSPRYSRGTTRKRFWLDVQTSVRQTFAAAPKGFPMNTRALVRLLVAVMVALSSQGLLAQTAAAPIRHLKTFVYPGAFGVTEAQGINQNGDITGVFIDGSNHVRGFIRYRDGSFSQPFAAPGDTVGTTQLSGINDTPTACGYYLYDPANYFYHGFFVTDGVFTSFDIAGAISTLVSGINDAGDFVGGASFGDGTEGFVDVGGTITTITIPSASSSIANAISSNGIVVGSYALDTVGHAFYRDTAGNLSYPLDFPMAGVTLTSLRGVNSIGRGVGNYYDANFVRHGFLYRPPSTFRSFDYPGGTRTALTGINDQGVVCGYYNATDGTVISFYGRAH